jgi:hypothetical protein
MSLSIKQKTGSRPFAVGRYLQTPITTATCGTSYFAGKIVNCPRRCCGDDGACYIKRVSFRLRKTGTIPKLEIFYCATHEWQFPIYPVGEVPYGRQPLVPINSYGEVRFPCDNSDNDSKPESANLHDAAAHVRENLKSRCPNLHLVKPSQANVRVAEKKDALQTAKPQDLTCKKPGTVLQSYLEFSQHPYLSSLFLGIVSFCYRVKWSTVNVIDKTVGFSIARSQVTQRRHVRGFLKLFGVGSDSKEKTSERIATIVNHRVTAFELMKLAEAVDVASISEIATKIIGSFSPSKAAYMALLTLGTEANFWGKAFFIA